MCKCEDCKNFEPKEDLDVTVETIEPKYKFSASSLAKLEKGHEDIQRLANEVIKYHDCTVVCVYRGKEEQDTAYAQGNSKLKFPNSKHNKNPSIAIDLAPYISGVGLSWDRDQCYLFAGYVLCCAARLGIDIRWGGDWDGDGDVKDQSFNDLVHFELITK